MEGSEDTATEKIARLEAAGIPVVERIDEIPDAVKGKLGARRDGRPRTQLDGIFIEVEVDGAVARDPELAAKLEEVCPVDIFAAEDDDGALRSSLEPGRMRALRALPRGGARRHRGVKKLYDGTELRP